VLLYESLMSVINHESLDFACDWSGQMVRHSRYLNTKNPYWPSCLNKSITSNLYDAPIITERSHTMSLSL